MAASASASAEDRLTETVSPDMRVEVDDVPQDSGDESDLYKTVGAEPNQEPVTPEEANDGAPNALLSAANTWADTLEMEPVTEDELRELGLDQARIMDMVRMIGGAVVLIAIVVVVVNSVLTTDAIANSTGPFDGVIDDLETTGVAAMGLLVVGLLVAAGAAIMRIMDRGF